MERVDLVGDLTAYGLLEPYDEDDIFGVLCENPILRYRSPGNSTRSRGRQRRCKIPSGSVGARRVRREGNPLLEMDWERMVVERESSGSVNSQWRNWRLEDARYGCR